MKQHTFKTNIHCENCIKGISPFLNQEIEIESWQVDTAHEDKLLKIESDLDEQTLVEIIEKAGFKAELIHTP
ncbi:MAG: heavy-metal-associated domain-containing protein [Microscillaceae bacterium]|nr:heavy-metal-associated domain-containing protein [Microscillaceae bacterium]